MRNDSIRSGGPAREALERMRAEAAMLRLRLAALSALAVLLVGGSIVVSFGALGPAVLRSEVLGLHPPLVAFVLGLGACIAAGVTILRLATANERAGAAERLLAGRARVRTSRVHSVDAVTRIDLVFDDGHRAELEIGAADAPGVLELVERART